MTLHPTPPTHTKRKGKCTCFCSRQCEHQKAPYILAPMEFRCFARERAKGLEVVVISVVMYGRSISAKLLMLNVTGKERKKKKRLR